MVWSRQAQAGSDRFISVSRCGKQQPQEAWVLGEGQYLLF